ncbi:NAD-dependent epimerase/dehydratase family protein [Neisseria sp. Ec49-e6-T10]|uniref:NAD-dependent epimerase/dehydratase family protein n=1 Tax=Neisseria sp. Ec49-e6-T10 TaxID=3140744 RepID=UPI003EBAEB33
MSKRILITGATGFIGSALLSQLQKKDCIVMGVTSSPKSVSEHIQYMNYLDVNCVKNLVSEFMPDQIVHLGAIANVNHGDLSDIYKVNVICSEILMDSIYSVCPAGTALILTSTAGIYGNQEEDYLHEELPMKPENHYSYSKMIMENMSKNYNDYLKIKIIRPFNIIGQGQKEYFLIPKMTKHFAHKESVIHLGNISSIRDYVDIVDCVNIYEKLILDEIDFDGALNICSGVGYRGEDILTILEEISHYSLNKIIDDRFIRKNEVWRLVGCTEKLKKIIGEDCIQISLRGILERLYSSYLCES